MEFITVSVSKHFLWVLQEHQRWEKENKSGSIKINYKCGGICNLENIEVKSPPPKEE